MNPDDQRMKHDLPRRANVPQRVAVLPARTPEERLAAADAADHYGLANETFATTLLRERREATESVRVTVVTGVKSER
jgi:hypothetical protein